LNFENKKPASFLNEQVFKIKQASKPGSVPPPRRGPYHLSGPAITCRFNQSTRIDIPVARELDEPPRIDAYLTFQRIRFTMHPMSPPGR
jgi:hypothetical protein